MFNTWPREVPLLDYKIFKEALRQSEGDRGTGNNVEAFALKLFHEEAFDVDENLAEE